MPAAVRIFISLKNKKAELKLAACVNAAGYKPVTGVHLLKKTGKPPAFVITDTQADGERQNLPFLLVCDGMTDGRRVKASRKLRGFILKPFRSGQVRTAVETALLFVKADKDRLNARNGYHIPVPAAKARLRFLLHEEEELLFDSLLGEIISQTDSEYGFIGEVCIGNEGRQFLRAHAVSDLTLDHRFSGFSVKHQKKGVVFYNLENLFGAVMRTGKPVISRSPADDRRSGGMPKGHPPLKSFMGIPLFRQNALIGVIALANNPAGYRKSDMKQIKPYLDTCAGLISAIKNRMEREKAQEELIRQSHFVQTLLDAIPAPVFYKDIAGRYLGCNTAFEKMLGKRKSEVVDSEAHDLFPKDFADIYTRTDSRLLKKPGIISFESQVLFSDSELHDAEIYKATYSDADGSVAGTIGVIFDITDLKSAERKLQNAVKEAEEEKAKSDAVISAIAYAVSIQDRKFRILFQNELHRELVGDHEGEICYTAYNKRKSICEGCPVALTLKDGSTHTIENKSTVQGRESYVEITSSPIKDSSGAIVAAIELVRDITERKKVEEELRTSRQRLALHVEQTPLGVIEWDLDFKVKEWNPAAQRIFGYGREDALGRHSSFIVPHAARKHVDEVWRKLLGQRGGSRSTNENVTKDGRSIICEWYNTPLIDRDGRTIGVASLVLDATERKLADEEIRESRYWLQEMQRVARLGSFVYDLENHSWTSSDILDTIFGIERAVTRSFNSWLDAVHPDEREELERYLADVVSSGSEFNKEYRIIRRNDGVERWVHGIGKFIYNSDGKMSRMVGTIQDVTEQKQREAALAEKTAQFENLSRMLEEWVTDEVKKNRDKDAILIKQSREAAMGEMIGNIAHQWRQPLNSVGMIVQLIEQSYKMGELTPEFVDELVRKAMEIIMFMSHTIDDFRNFFKPERERLPFSVRDAVKRTVSLIEASFRNNNIEIVLDMEKDAVVNGYKNEYSQALLNLLNNARDVLLERAVSSPKIWIRLTVGEKGSMLSVCDNGGGISEDILDRIFEPYFTTKSQGRGTGIGLYMSKTIIETNMNGKLNARNTRNGAEFVIEV